MRTLSNIVLIGMPGVGKSTLGVLLAKATGRGFVDTDLLIQTATGERLQTILDRDGPERFCALEEQHVCSLDCRDTVIATGGSVVYSAAAMDHLADDGRVILLDLPLAELEARLDNLAIRGVVMRRGQSLADLFAERQPLYQRYADIAIPCAGLTHDEGVLAILRAMGQACDIRQRPADR